MPLSSFQQAVAGLTKDEALVVQLAFTSWLSDVRLRRVGQNIEDESALPADDFLSLLRSFANHLMGGTSTTNSWKEACHAHKRRGKRLADSGCPSILGRATSLEDHAKRIAEVPTSALSQTEAKRLLLKHAGSTSLINFESVLRNSPLGRYLIWATFDASNPNSNPFDRIPRTRIAICTALGLGDFTRDTSLVILVWTHADCGSPPLHRPTVADAGAYPFYRPCPDVDAQWGLTEPLPPNAEALVPQPEVVMPETSSRGLRLPFHVV